MFFELVIPTKITTVLLKSTGITGSLSASYYAYRTLPIPAVRRKLLKIFQRGNICVEKNPFFKKSGKVRIYPTIHHVEFRTDCLTAVFSIPSGVNPETVENNMWQFKQEFPGDIDIAREGKKGLL